MLNLMKSRLLGASTAGLMLAGFAAMPLQAAAQEQAAQAAPVAVESVDQMTVVRDAQTGQLRAATGEEHAAMMAAKAKNLMRASPARTQQKHHHSGARGARLTDEMMSASVVVRHADGTLGEQCFDSQEQADAAVKNAVQPVTKYVTE